MSEQVHWDPARAKSRAGQWGCPSCGNEDSRVREVDRDTEHIRVRLRECTRCGTRWATEERRLSGPEAFFARAEKRRYRSFIKHRIKARKCLVCHVSYASGKYLEHTQESEAHQAKVALSERRQAERERKYRREHARKQRLLRRQLIGKKVCQRCGESYDATIPFALRTHKGTDPVHRQIVKEENLARRDRRRQAAKRGRANAA